MKQRDVDNVNTVNLGSNIPVCFFTYRVACFFGMEEPDYRVYIRIPVERPPGFVDPPSFVWNAEKEGMLWKAISARGRGDIHCNLPWTLDPLLSKRCF